MTDEAFVTRSAELSRLAQVELESGRFPAAESFARRALRLDSANSAAELILGQALEASGRHAEATEAFGRAARLLPDDPGPARALAGEWRAPLVAGVSLLGAFVLHLLGIVAQDFDERLVAVALGATAVAIVATTLVLLGRRRRRFRSLTSETRAAIETAERLTRREAAAALGGPLLIIGISVIVLAGSAFLFVVGRKPSIEIQPGDCFTLTQRTTIERVSRIPCELPHGTEVYAAYTDPAPLGAPFAGVDAERAAVRDRCVADYRAFVGTPYRAESTLLINILVPEQPYWDAGIRGMWCSVEDRRGDKLVGSMRNSGR
jgi:hypothetical protein